jgi:hypothetical protein
VPGNPNLAKTNFGFDDERGDYNVVMHDHMRFRYEVLGVMGKGSFGQVLKCHDFRTNELVAIKVRAGGCLVGPVPFPPPPLSLLPPATTVHTKTDDKTH